MGNENSRPTHATGVGAAGAPMSKNLQHKFSRGIQYNMKVLIRGDKNVGKTSLLKRLQGLGFTEDYEPTPEIQAGTIKWNYKSTDDIVKVEVWDVVDIASKKNKRASLKLVNNDTEEKDSIQGADASIINVYKGVQGVIIVVDITKPWSFDYAKNKIDEVPHDIPVLLLASKRDLYRYRQVSVDEMQMWVSQINEVRDIHYAEASMKDGFGLAFLYTYLSLPFLILQKETLLKQLRTNEQEVADVTHDIYKASSSKEQNYDYFLSAKSGGNQSGSQPSTPTRSATPEPSSPNKSVQRQNSHPINSQSSLSRDRLPMNSQSQPDLMRKAPSAQSPSPVSQQKHVQPTPTGDSPAPGRKKSSFTLNGESAYDFYGEEAEPEILKGFGNVEDSEDDEDIPNPMVARDLDLSDEEPVKKVKQSSRNKERPSKSQPRNESNDTRISSHASPPVSSPFSFSSSSQKVEAPSPKPGPKDDLIAKAEEALNFEIKEDIGGFFSDDDDDDEAEIDFGNSVGGLDDGDSDDEPNPIVLAPNDDSSDDDNDFNNNNSYNNSNNNNNNHDSTYNNNVSEGKNDNGISTRTNDSNSFYSDNSDDDNTIKLDEKAKQQHIQELIEQQKKMLLEQQQMLKQQRQKDESDDEGNGNSYSQFGDEYQSFGNEGNDDRKERSSRRKKPKDEDGKKRRKNRSEENSENRERRSRKPKEERKGRSDRGERTPTRSSRKRREE